MAETIFALSLDEFDIRPDDTCLPLEHKPNNNDEDDVNWEYLFPKSGRIVIPKKYNFPARLLMDTFWKRTRMVLQNSAKRWEDNYNRVVIEIGKTFSGPQAFSACTAVENMRRMYNAMLLICWDSDSNTTPLPHFIWKARLVRYKYSEELRRLDQVTWNRLVSCGIMSAESNPVETVGNQNLAPVKNPRSESALSHSNSSTSTSDRSESPVTPSPENGSKKRRPGRPRKSISTTDDREFDRSPKDASGSIRRSSRSSAGLMRSFTPEPKSKVYQRKSINTKKEYMGEGSDDDTRESTKEVEDIDEELEDLKELTEEEFMAKHNSDMIDCLKIRQRKLTEALQKLTQHQQQKKGPGRPSNTTKDLEMLVKKNSSSESQQASEAEKNEGEEGKCDNSAGFCSESSDSSNEDDSADSDYTGSPKKKKARVFNKTPLGSKLAAARKVREEHRRSASKGVNGMSTPRTTVTSCSNLQTSSSVAASSEPPSTPVAAPKEKQRDRTFFEPNYHVQERLFLEGVRLYMMQNCDPNGHYLLKSMDMIAKTATKGVDALLDHDDKTFDKAMHDVYLGLLGLQVEMKAAGYSDPILTIMQYLPGMIDKIAGVTSRKNNMYSLLPTFNAMPTQIPTVSFAQTATGAAPSVPSTSSQAATTSSSHNNVLSTAINAVAAYLTAQNTSVCTGTSSLNAVASYLNATSTMGATSTVTGPPYRNTMMSAQNVVTSSLNPLTSAQKLVTSSLNPLTSAQNAVTASLIGTLPTTTVQPSAYQMTTAPQVAAQPFAAVTTAPVLPLSGCQTTMVTASHNSLTPPPSETSDKTDSDSNSPPSELAGLSGFRPYGNQKTTDYAFTEDDIIVTDDIPLEQL